MSPVQNNPMITMYWVLIGVCTRICPIKKRVGVTTVYHWSWKGMPASATTSQLMAIQWIHPGKHHPVEWFQHHITFWIKHFGICPSNGSTWLLHTQMNAVTTKSLWANAGACNAPNPFCGYPTWRWHPWQPWIVTVKSNTKSAFFPYSCDWAGQTWSQECIEWRWRHWHKWRGIWQSNHCGHQALWVLQIQIEWMPWPSVLPSVSFFCHLDLCHLFLLNRHCEEITLK